MPHKMTKNNGKWSLNDKDGKEVTSGSLATVMRADNEMMTSSQHDRALFKEGKITRETVYKRAKSRPNYHNRPDDEGGPARPEKTSRAEYVDIMRENDEDDAYEAQMKIDDAAADARYEAARKKKAKKKPKKEVLIRPSQTHGTY